MWPFDRSPTRRELIPPAPDQGQGPSADRLAKIEFELEKLSRKVTQLDVDWSGWFDKYRRLYARIAKRQERDEAGEVAQDTPQPRQDAPQPPNGRLAVSGGPTPRVRGNY